MIRKTKQNKTKKKKKKKKKKRGMILKLLKDKKIIKESDDLLFINY